MALIPPDPENDRLESALFGLTPAPLKLDRDRLMFQAGAVSARADAPRPWAWPALAAVLALVVASETIVLSNRPVREVTVVQAPPALAQAATPQVVILSQTAHTDKAPQTWAGGEGLEPRRQLLRHGLEGLPDLPPLLSRSEEPDTGQGMEHDSPGSLRRYELNKVMNMGGPS